MVNIYCSSCGSKHLVGAKFCSSCGKSLSVFNETVDNIPTKLSKSTFLDDEGLPTKVVRPQKLSYSIEKPMSNRMTVQEAIQSPPSEERKPRAPVNGYKKISTQEYLSSSIKECASSKVQEINE